MAEGGKGLIGKDRCKLNFVNLVNSSFTNFFSQPYVGFYGLLIDYLS